MTEPRFTALLLAISAKTSSLSRQVQAQTLHRMTSAPFQWARRENVPLHPWSALLAAEELERKVGTAFHDLTGHSLPARLGLTGLTLHHHKPFANKLQTELTSPANLVNISLCC